MKVTDINLTAFSKEDLAELESIHGKALKAAVEHVKRQCRDSHPEGTFDKQDRFYIDEGCSCCSSIRSPSRAHPFSQMIHGRTIDHCSVLFGVDAEEAKNALRGIKRVAKSLEAA